MAAKEPPEQTIWTLNSDTNKAVTTSKPSEQTRSGDESEQKITASILVAEDTPTSQMLIETLLKNIGCEVVIAQDGAEALEKIKLQHFDLVIMDIRMPNMSGYEATELMRKEGHTVPIVALTAYATSNDREKYIDAGCNDYLSKPLDQKKLGEIIRKYVTCHDICATSGKSN